MAALIYANLLVLGGIAAWNTPLRQVSGCQPDKQKNQDRADNQSQQNTCPVLGEIIRAPIGSAWEFAAEHHFFDASIALFTLFLAGFTGTLWWTTRRLLHHTPGIERAYMSWGGVRIIILHPLPAGHHGPPMPVPTFQFHVNNHGKTTAETWEYGIGFCDANAVPTPVDGPPYAITHHHDWIGPGTQSRPIANIPLPPNDNTAAFGRIYYRDIFGNRHSSGFINRIEEGQSHPLLAPQPYTASD